MAWRNEVDELRRRRDGRWHRTRLELARARLLSVHRSFQDSATKALEDAAKMVMEQTEELQEEFLAANRELIEAADAAGLVVRMEWSQAGELTVSFHRPRPFAFPGLDRDQLRRALGVRLCERGNVR